jgi:NAD(P)-dependent dehydrogenase (short-subunit alcohol dehydrogenase family)
VAKIISLNTMALTQLASAVVPRLIKAGEGEGAIINISLVVRARAGILPDRLWRNQSLCPLPHPRSSP